jgi:hypothetical protein
VLAGCLLHRKVACNARSQGIAGSPNDIVVERPSTYSTSINAAALLLLFAAPHPTCAALHASHQLLHPRQS